jgi:hypothetical protein
MQTTHKPPQRPFHWTVPVELLCTIGGGKPHMGSNPTFPHPRPAAVVRGFQPSRSGLPSAVSLTHSSKMGDEVSRDHLRQFDQAFGGARRGRPKGSGPFGVCRLEPAYTGFQRSGPAIAGARRGNKIWQDWRSHSDTKVRRLLRQRGAVMRLPRRLMRIRAICRFFWPGSEWRLPGAHRCHAEPF